jgi:antitoxin FitA
MTSITIRDVPPEVRNELAARAARQGQSMQEFLRLHLIELTEKPSNAEVIARARARVERMGLEVSTEDILAWRDADRP